MAGAQRIRVSGGRPRGCQPSIQDPIARRLPSSVTTLGEHSPEPRCPRRGLAPSAVWTERRNVLPPVLAGEAAVPWRRKPGAGRPEGSWDSAPGDHGLRAAEQTPGADSPCQRGPGAGITALSSTGQARRLGSSGSCRQASTFTGLCAPAGRGPSQVLPELQTPACPPTRICACATRRLVGNLGKREGAGARSG